ncbi:MAG: DUF2723 domain-containing protein [Anaerolineae bacterium]|nr:DUF2723 domain-containing protein [Anaerolineae bacterium]
MTTLRRDRLWPLALTLLAALLLAYTLQPDINGSHDAYMEDVGEFQNVLAHWGTAHSPGYPLYSLVGAAFVAGVHLAGVPYALAASLFSAVITLAALLGLYYLLRVLDVMPPLAALACLVLAATRPVWVHASVAEVYAPVLGFIVLAHLIAVQWRRDRRPKRLYQLLATLGFGVGHHPLVGLAAPGLALFVAPLALRALWERPRRLLPALVSLLAPFLIHLYQPLRAWTGAAWVYGQPRTWDGFWFQVTAREYASLLRPSLAPGVLAEGMLHALTSLAGDLTWPLLVVGIVGLVVGVVRGEWPPTQVGASGPDGQSVYPEYRALRTSVDAAVSRPRRRTASRRLPRPDFQSAPPLLALSFATLVVVNVGFASFYPRAVFLSATLMPALLGLTVGVGLAAQAVVSRWRAALPLAAGGLALASVVLVVGNASFVRGLTYDPYGRQRIETTARAGLQPPDPILVAAWGRDYFALAYGELTGALPPLGMVDHRANMAELVESGRPVYVVSPTFYTLPFDWWQKRLGRARLTSYPGDLVRVSNERLLGDEDLPAGATPVVMGPITLRGWQATPQDGGRAWALTLYWTAPERVREDYSVFVHVSDRDQIDGPDAIIAQADRGAPVYGWYPTSRWSRDEIVRDDYLIPIPDGKTARLIAVGLYAQDGHGVFQNLGQATIPLPGH